MNSFPLLFPFPLSTPLPPSSPLSSRSGWESPPQRMQLHPERIRVERVRRPVRHGHVRQLRPGQILQKLGNVSVSRHLRASPLPHDFHDDADGAGHVAHRSHGSQIRRPGNSGLSPPKLLSSSSTTKPTTLNLINAIVVPFRDTACTVAFIGCRPWSTGFWWLARFRLPAFSRRRLRRR